MNISEANWKNFWTPSHAATILPLSPELAKKCLKEGITPIGDMVIGKGSIAESDFTDAEFEEFDEAYEKEMNHG